MLNLKLIWVTGWNSFKAHKQLVIEVVIIGKYVTSSDNPLTGMQSVSTISFPFQGAQKRPPTPSTAWRLQ